MTEIKSLIVRQAASRAWMAVLLLSAASACGGGAGPTLADADVDAMSDAGPGDASTRCASDDTCDDGLFCNGSERCLPDDPTADINGCVDAAEDACMAGQTCDEDADLCQTVCDISGDADGDGHDSIDCGGDDCDDADATRYPGNSEVCDSDGHDEDCDPSTLGSDGDADGDGHLRLECCNPQADGTTLCGDDCDDTEMLVNPDALEVCDGDVDNDCNGLADAADGVCVPCAAGYRGFDESCTNIDECAEGAPCGGAVGATCSDTPGSYSCTCPAGYTGAGAGAGGTCADNDECATSTPCGSAATACTNTPGSYSCSCAPGYSAPASGGTCSDVDECLDTATCGPTRAGCTNTLGSYICSCTSGYEAPPTGGTCGSADQCGTGTPCGAHGTSCTNTPGSYQCTCQLGYEAPSTGGICADVNECSIPSTCGSARAGCTNTPGTYQCTCNPGFTADASGGTCTDVDECVASAPCGAGATACTNTSGSYSCVCATGYTAPASGGTCTNINECADPTTCGSARAGCTDTIGSYRCLCDPGFEAPPTGGTCGSVDQCGTGTPCGTHGTSCTNTLGSYQCTCDPGYAAPASGGTCADVNECDSGSTCGAARAGCTNTPGSYQCTCNAGFTADASGGTCTDVDECAAGTPCGSGACTNTPGSYACSCAPGYSAPPSGGTCTDVDECATPTTCGSERADCTNTAGSYQCTCNAGFGAPTSGGICTNVDECSTGTDDCDRDPAATCTDSVGSFSCSCPANFTGSAHGPAGCLLTDAHLSSLAPSLGALNPAFNATTFAYGLSVPSNTTSIALTPTVLYPAHATIRVNGVVVASGSASAPIAITGAITAITITVTAEVGTPETYTVVVARASAYIKASNTDALDAFGEAVALSADGSTLAVGAYREDSSATTVGGSQASNSADGAGAVYVFTRTGATWSQQAYIKASNAEPGDSFGWSVSLSNDGSTLAVGAPGEDSDTNLSSGGDQADNSASLAGAVYVFTRAGTTWSQQAYVKANNSDPFDQFGSSLALSGNGATLAVGTTEEASNARGVGGDPFNNNVDIDGSGGSGAVYVFTRSGTNWTLRAYIKASNAESGDRFGSSVALSDAGSTLAVGAPSESSSATDVGGLQDNGAGGSGAVYVFSLSGTTWSQQAYVKASNTGVGDNFGTSVAVSGDGATIAVGAPGERSSATGVNGNQTDDSANQAGAVYVFTRSGTTWSQEAYIKASNTELADSFSSVALSTNGSTLLVGAHREASNATDIGGDQTNNSASSAGAIYLFTRAGTTWSQQTYLKASNTQAGDHFGEQVALSDDSSTLAVGAQYEDSNAIGVGADGANNSASSAGAAYVF